MRPKSFTLTATGTTAWIPVNYRQDDFNVGVQVDVSAGATLSWIVEVTSDDVFDSSVTPVAFTADGGLASGTGDEIGAITIPCRAVRLNATITGGTVTMTLVQGS